jgi:hypothetical protein
MIKPTHPKRHVIGQRRHMIRTPREFVAEVKFPGGLQVPVNPSVGLIATTPNEVQQIASDSGPYARSVRIAW